MAGVQTYGYRAAGRWRNPAAEGWLDSENPATGAVWARIADCGGEDVAHAVDAAARSFREGPWPEMNGTGRGRLIRQLGDVVRRNAGELAAIETRDNGKLPAHIAPALQGWLADSFDYYAGLADKFEGALIPVDAAGVLNFTRWEPFGVCALITAWNSPLGVLIWKLAPALAAGNTVVIKPSEHASASTLALAELLEEETELPPGVINVVTGRGGTAGAALVAHPETRMVSFTGSVEGGRQVAASAAQGVKPLVLELGGKSPQIVFDDADIGLAVNGVAGGIFPVSGQSCIAGSRALVHRERVDEFCERLVEVAARAKIGDPSDAEADIGPIANGMQYQRILADIAQAEADGVQLLLDGRGKGPGQGYYIGPTVFADVAPSMPLAQREVFGPVLAIIPFDNEAEALEIANGTEYGLAAGIWSRDVARALRLADRVDAGTVYINNYFGAAAQSPVGGCRQSGYGRENGIEGMRAYLQCKSVWLATDPHEPPPFAG